MANQTEAAKPGRPCEFTEQIADRICNELCEGKSLRTICLPDEMPNCSTVFRWLADPRFETFCKQYTRAREVQADALFDECLDIADDGSNDYVVEKRQDGSEFERVNHDHISRSKLRIDTRKWYAGKLAPKKYGEKVVQEISGPDGGPVDVRRIEIVAASGNGSSPPSA